LQGLHVEFFQKNLGKNEEKEGRELRLSKAKIFKKKMWKVVIFLSWFCMSIYSEILRLLLR
jgi:hypothetical protein